MGPYGRVPVKFLDLLEEFMAKDNLPAPAIPLTWWRDAFPICRGLDSFSRELKFSNVQTRNFVLAARERKRDAVNEEEFLMMMRRWLRRMEQVANDEQLSLSNERLQLKQISFQMGDAWLIMASESKCNSHMGSSLD